MTWNKRPPITADSLKPDGIAHMIRAALAEGQHTDPDKSVLTQAGITLDHPETYVGSSDLKEFEVFIAGILRVAQNELFARRDQRRHAGRLPRHSPYKQGARMVLQECRMI